MTQQVQYFEALVVGYDKGHKKIKDLATSARKDSERAIKTCEVIYRRADNFHKRDSVA